MFDLTEKEKADAKQKLPRTLPLQDCRLTSSVGLPTASQTPAVTSSATNDIIIVAVQIRLESWAVVDDIASKNKKLHRIWWQPSLRIDGSSQGLAAEFQLSPLVVLGYS